MTIYELSKLPWNEVKKNALTILDFNASNDKITYQDFRNRDNEYKKTIINILHILGYQDIHNTKEYYQGLWNSFQEINTIVGIYNQAKNNKQEKLKVYKSACMFYFKENAIYDEIEQKNIITWYQSYRGMAKLSAYRGNLNHALLKDRVVQHMQQDTAKRYINHETAEDDRKNGVERYSKQVQNTLQDNI